MDKKIQKENIRLLLGMTVIDEYSALSDLLNHPTHKILASFPRKEVESVASEMAKREKVGIAALSYLSESEVFDQINLHDVPGLQKIYFFLADRSPFWRAKFLSSLFVVSFVPESGDVKPFVDKVEVFAENPETFLFKRPSFFSHLSEKTQRKWDFVLLPQETYAHNFKDRLKKYETEHYQDLYPYFFQSIQENAEKREILSLLRKYDTSYMLPDGWFLMNQDTSFTDNVEAFFAVNDMFKKDPMETKSLARLLQIDSSSLTEPNQFIELCQKIKPPKDLPVEFNFGTWSMAVDSPHLLNKDNASEMKYAVMAIEKNQEVLPQNFLNSFGCFCAALGVQTKIPVGPFPTPDQKSQKDFLLQVQDTEKRLSEVLEKFFKINNVFEERKAFGVLQKETPQAKKSNKM